MAPAKVALAGATGNVGLPTLNALLTTDHSIVVLTRKDSNNTSKIPKSSKITVKEIDYSSVSDLTTALEGVKVVISTLATTVVGSQDVLIDAAIAAGVERYLPSEFGSDTAHPTVAKLPVFKHKIETQEYLKSKVQENPNFSYTLLMTGPFFDWGLAVGFVLNPAKHTGTLYNGGDAKFSTTTLASIAKAVVGVISHLSETKNKAVYVHDTVITQNQIIAYAKEKDGKEWETTTKDTKELYDESMKELTSGGDVPKAMMGFLVSGIFGGDQMGATFEGRDMSELLGVHRMSESEVKKVVQQYV